MISVNKAEQLILDQLRSYGTEAVSIDAAVGRILAENIYADRDMPPFDRVTMDGIAFNYAYWSSHKGPMRIKAKAAAGHPKIILSHPSHCIEVMTGAILPEGCDTVIRYEELSIALHTATILSSSVVAGQCIHRQALEHKAGTEIIKSNNIVTVGMLNALTTVGRSSVLVYKLPKIGIVTTGDELVPIDSTPAEHQIRISNAYAVQGLLKADLISSEIIHSRDTPEELYAIMNNAIISYDIVIIIGGVSQGKHDYVPDTLEGLKVKEYFHKIAQRPGKPMWFGCHENKAVVFALPGNPVSSFLCAVRYIRPWVRKCFFQEVRPSIARLSQQIIFKPDLSYFPLVKIVNIKGEIWAKPIVNSGSGDLTSLINADAFIELPPDRQVFEKGELFPFFSF